MDYILADRHVIPPEHWRFYDEQVVYLPDAYLPPASNLQIAETTPSRADCGLPPTGVVFCSFNHDYKILPAVFAVWMRLLLQVPGSVLWLMARSATCGQVHRPLALTPTGWSSRSACRGSRTTWRATASRICFSTPTPTTPTAPLPMRCWPACRC
jgi:hypothetical protein